MTHTRHMRLGAMLHANGQHTAGWRYEEAELGGDHSFRHHLSLAKTAERGKFDMIFLADSVGIRDRGGLEPFSRSNLTATFEPLTLLSALAAVTEHIGLVATASTTYNEPYHIARKFASLDHISEGRAGWNVVTSFTDAEAHNFGRDKHPEHSVHYARAAEFVSVVKGLWDSWEDDAFLRDKVDGRFIDPAKLHVLDHKGANFSVRGPLNVARPPQGHPVIFQAGASEEGRSLAGAIAEVIFAAAQSLPQAQAFYSDMKARAVALGRSRDDLKIMPGILPIIGHTEAEARAKHQALRDLVHPSIGVGQLSSMLGFDISAHPLDGPLPDLPVTEAHRSRQQMLVDLARRQNLTIRQLYQRLADGNGHGTIVGTPRQIADELVH